MKSQGGFTLIEALVAGIISVIIPAVVITLLRVNNTEISSNSTQLRLSQIAGLVAEDIRQSAQLATSVYSVQDVDSPLKPCLATAPPSSGAVAVPGGVSFCNGATFISSYQINPVALNSPTAWLMKKTGLGPLEYFIVAGDTVQVMVDPSAYLQNPLAGVLGLSPSGQAVWFNFRYSMNVSGVPTTLPMQTETYLCRNFGPP